MGNIALLEFYRLPLTKTATQGAALKQLCDWYFVGTLFKTIVLLLAWLPPLIVTMGCAAVLAVGFLARHSPAPERAKVFPATADQPWILALAAVGVAWVLSHQLEPALDSSFEELQRSIFYQGRPHGGMEVIVLCEMALYFLCAWAVTRRLARSEAVRPFYASLVVLIEVCVLAGLIALPLIDRATLLNPSAFRESFQPAWLTVLSSAAVLGLTAWHAGLIRRRAITGTTIVSLWPFDAPGLVRFGGMIGLATACAAALLLFSSIVLASNSTLSIRALLDWGRSIREPAARFQPHDYIGTTQLFDWLITGPGLVCIALAGGIALALILSALEFIRFNAFRLYRLQKIRAHAAVAALNE